MGGFLTTLTQAWTENPTDPAFESKVMPGMPLQVLCYERADDLAAGVSGVVTRARGIRASFPDLKPEEIPMAAAVQAGARALSAWIPSGPAGARVRCVLADVFLRLGRGLCGVKDSRLRTAMDARLPAQA